MEPDPNTSTAHDVPKITGYRVLTEAETAGINSVKSLEGKIAAEWQKVERLPGADKRWLAMARTDFERACMALVRAIAKPSSPFEER